MSVSPAGGRAGSEADAACAAATASNAKANAARASWSKRKGPPYCLVPPNQPRTTSSPSDSVPLSTPPASAAAGP